MTEPKASRSTLWPAPFLLQIYEKAVEEGCCRVPVENIARAKSLIASFHRLRRRSDIQHKLYIRPEFHLVGAMWEESLSTVLFVFNSLPDGAKLPAIESVESRSKPSAMPVANELSSDLPHPTDVDGLDIAGLMADLEASAAKRDPN